MGFALKLSRHEHAAKLRKNIHDFAKGTGTTSLQKHLANEHIEMQVSICDKKDIKITASSLAKCVAAYHAECGEMPDTDDTARPKFSNEAFVDAIVEWIVADDQVDL